MGATCALYNRLDGGMLCSISQWNTPADYNPVDKPEGHLCYDVIRRAGDGQMIVRNLPETPYFTSDPNVRKYGLLTYVGRGVKFGSSTVGSLCVVYRKDYAPSSEDEKLMGILAAAIGVEEARRREQEALRVTNETLNAIIASAPLAIYDLDSAGSVQKVWNPAAEQIFGWPPKRHWANHCRLSRRTSSRNSLRFSVASCVVNR
jgi:PAS domain-containing protein